MGKYSKVIKKTEFGWRFADNGWVDIYCKNCGWTYNHDVHVSCDYKFCPGCGGSVDGDRMKYEIELTNMGGLIHCKGCGETLGHYDDPKVDAMNFCPHCGRAFTY